MSETGRRFSRVPIFAMEGFMQNEDDAAAGNAAGKQKTEAEKRAERLAGKHYIYMHT